LRFLSRALRRSSTSAVLVVGATALACGLVGPAAAQQIISGPLKVTDSGPGVSPSGYAIKGVTSFSNDSAVFGYGTGASALNIDGVTGYVDSPQSVGVVGWADTTATAGYGVYGYSGVGNGVYGQSNSASVASIYGVNNTVGGTAMYGFSAGQGVLGVSSLTNGVVGITNTPYGIAHGMTEAGVLGVDNSSPEGDSGNFGVVGMSLNTGGGTGVYGSGTMGVQGVGTIGPFTLGVYGTGFNGVLGYGTGPSGFGVMGYTENGDGAGVSGFAVSGLNAAGGAFSSLGTADALDAGGSGGGSTSLGIATGEAGAFFGGSGNAAHPALVVQGSVGTDTIGTYNSANAETFVIQAGTADYSGYAPSGASDAQVSGDLYVQGAVYQLCSSNSGIFPVTAPKGHCYASVYPATRTKTSIGSNVTTYSSQGSIPTIEDFGEAQLVNGQANVPLERTFASTIDRRGSYLVFVTPEGDCNGLYVTAKALSGFVVRELRNGRSTLAFQYRIVARPYGNSSARLPEAPVQPRQPAALASSHVLALRKPRMLALPHLPRGVTFANGTLPRTPKTGSLPRRLPPPTMSASFRR
jgi:hypothetical protein